MQEVKEFLQKYHVFYVATAEGDQPRVRPYGAVAEVEGKLYICTNNTKPSFAQMKANPRIEICSMGENGQWLRLAATATPDPRREVKAAVLEQCPGLKSLYSVDDGIFEVLALSNCTASFCSMAGAPRVVTF